MINETKNTSANEWRFDEGCEKSPSAVILAFFTGTFSLRNLNTHTSTINFFPPYFEGTLFVYISLCK